MGISVNDKGALLSIISFTKAGMLLSEHIRKALDGEVEVRLYVKCKACKNSDRNASVSVVEGSVGAWAGQRMQEQSAVLFIGACGIAVRAVAPFLTDKLQDAPVLVMDEQGNYVIPILAGHMGGANKLARMLAKKIGAQPVITTATDLHDQFAVDVFAKESGFAIDPKEGIAKVSAKVLAGEEITVAIETGHDAGFAEKNGMRRIPYPPTGYTDIVITSKEDVFDAALRMRPKEYILGFGCKRGKRAEEIEQFVSEKMRENGILMTQIYALASIAQKKDEAGIKEWCRKSGIPFMTYTAEELQEVKGDFTQSAFVKERVGVDNVCERAALKACGTGGKLVAQKCAENGMTLAIAKREWRAESWRLG